jgi:hypothetical protein
MRDIYLKKELVNLINRGYLFFKRIESAAERGLFLERLLIVWTKTNYYMLKDSQLFGWR